MKNKRSRSQGKVKYSPICGDRQIACHLDAFFLSCRDDTPSKPQFNFSLICNIQQFLRILISSFCCFLYTGQQTHSYVIYSSLPLLIWLLTSFACIQKFLIRKCLHNNVIPLLSTGLHSSYFSVCLFVCFFHLC